MPFPARIHHAGLIADDGSRALWVFDESDQRGCEPSISNIRFLEVHIEGNVVGGIADDVDSRCRWCRDAEATADMHRRGNYRW
jgi:hypothetical protein